MFPDHTTIDQLAHRIERAYRHRQAGSRRQVIDPRVWAEAAQRLVQLHDECPEYPLDPELFVTSQPTGMLIPDPWDQLANEQAVQRYRNHIDRIVEQLRYELQSEIQQAEQQIETGRSIITVLHPRRDRRYSPLCCYIVARRAQREDLTSRYLQRALDQHQSCPLYRLAATSWIAAHDYPDRTDQTPQQQVPDRASALDDQPSCHTSMTGGLPSSTPVIQENATLFSSN